MKNLNKTKIFALITIVLVSFVYLYEYRGSSSNSANENEIMKFPIDQISYFQMVKPDNKFAFQRDSKGWQLIEPIYEVADGQRVEEMLTELSNEKTISVVKKTESSFSETELAEFGLDKPALLLVLKNNGGLSRKIAVGSVKNYEGQSYLLMDSGNTIYLAGANWSNRAADPLIVYRDKRLFREPLSAVNRIKIKSLNEFIELTRVENKWVSQDSYLDIDQSQVRDLLKKIVDSEIEEYVFEGEPSQNLLAEKGFENSEEVSLELITDMVAWKAKLSASKNDRKLYVLSDRPTYLARVNPLIWEAVAGRTLDSFRDRVSPFLFSADEVKKIYYKNGSKETNLVFNSGSWLMGSKNSAYLEVDKTDVAKTLKNIHSLRVSEFLDEKQKNHFVGENMLILKSDTEKLVLQINWGPEFKMKKNGSEKSYYYARTHLSNKIFALESEVVDAINLDSDRVMRKIKKTQDGDAEAPPELESSRQ